MAALKSAAGWAWINRVAAVGMSAGKPGSVLHVEFAWRTNPFVTRELHSFLKREMRPGSGPFTLADYRPTYALITSPTISILCEGYTDSGLNEVRINNALPRDRPRTTGFQFDQLYQTGIFDPDEFWGRLLSQVDAGRQQIRFRRQGDLLEVAAWSPGMSPERGRVCVFDLARGGHVVYYFNHLVARWASSIEVQYELVGGCWVPARYRQAVVNPEDRSWERLEEVEFHGWRVNEELDDRLFSVHGLPLAKTRFMAQDLRTGRNVPVPLEALK